MSRLTSLSTDPIVKEYMQGAAKQAIQPVAEFLAPTVPVAKARGHFKKWKPKEWLTLPNTRRPLKGEATVVGLSLDDARYNCEPHALDFPVDIEEKDEAAELMNLVQEGADLVAQLSAMAHEHAVVSLALAEATAADNKRMELLRVDDLTGDARSKDVLLATAVAHLIEVVGALAPSQATALRERLAPWVEVLAVQAKSADIASQITTNPFVDLTEAWAE